jgi:hypothetical protein
MVYTNSWESLGQHSDDRRIRPDFWAHNASYPMDTRDSFPGKEGLRGAGDHSPPTSVEVTNLWSYTFTPLCLHGVVFR